MKKHYRIFDKKTNNIIFEYIVFDKKTDTKLFKSFSKTKRVNIVEVVP